MPLAKKKSTTSRDRDLEERLSQRTRQIVAFAGCLNNASRVDGFDPRQLQTCLNMLEQMAEEVRDLNDERASTLAIGPAPGGRPSAKRKNKKRKSADGAAIGGVQ